MIYQEELTKILKDLAFIMHHLGRVGLSETDGKFDIGQALSAINSRNEKTLR
jgi:hypothetical protein